MTDERKAVLIVAAGLLLVAVLAHLNPGAATPPRPGTAHGYFGKIFHGKPRTEPLPATRSPSEKRPASQW